MIARLERFLAALEPHGVKCIVIGGWAATIHGSARSTNDVAFVYSREPLNLARLAAALEPFQPYLRGAPPGLPFRWDAVTIRQGLNFTLTTTIGDVDFLGEVAGGGSYEQLLADTIEVEAFGVRYRCVTLEKLIQRKRAAGRPRDLEVIAELQALLEERRNLDSNR